MKPQDFLFGFMGVTLLFSSSCKTLSDIREEEEFELQPPPRSTARVATEERADLANANEELKLEIVRLNGRIEEQAHYSEQETEALRNEIANLKIRIEKLENARATPASVDEPSSTETATYSAGKTAYDKKDFLGAIQILKSFLGANPKGGDVKKAQYLLAQAYFENKDYAASAVEFGKYKKANPGDSLAAMATFRQALCFKNMGKTKEAKLFFQEIIDRYPKSSVAQRAKKELK